MRKITLLTLTLVSLGILPVAAQLGEVWTDFKSYSTDLQDYFQYNLSDNLRPIESQSRNALNNARGELNIPNPVAAGQKVRDDLINYSYNLDSKANRFENNSAVQGNLVSNELNRVITRGAAVGVLGKNGQIRTKAKLEDIQTSLKTVATVNKTLDTDINTYITKAGTLITGGTGTNIVTTVDQIMTQGLAALLTANQEIIKIQKEQIKIVGESYSKSTKLEQSLQYSNLNLASISQQAEETNRARRVETSTEAARLLRATSQIDLFGRKFDK
jgi:hypothetical protein